MYPRLISEAEGKNDLTWSSITVVSQEQVKHANRPRKFFGRALQKDVQKGKRTREILHNVTGIAQGGKVLAIMGSSGAGKTTLLNVLTQRNLAGLDVTGAVLIDGREATKNEMRSLSAFVQQDDLFVGTFTVREHLKFMAALRMGDKVARYEREARVEEVIIQMGLTPCSNTVIGMDNLKGLSCGEKKRLAFASEILTAPTILFCDEPTSGLDAFMAEQVVRALRALSDQGMTVVTTIHQPSSNVFQLFHNVCLMACGRIVYLGPVDRVTTHFSNCGFPCPMFFNPADHVVRTLAVVDADRVNCLKTITRIRDQFLRSPEGVELIRISEKTKARKHQLQLQASTVDKVFDSFRQNYAAGFFTQFFALFSRAMMSVTRNPNLLRMRIFEIAITALTTGIVYFQTDITAATVITINGILFNHIRNTNFMLQFPSVEVLTSELPIIMRENANGIYSIGAYFLSKNLAELPQYAILPTVYMTIVYWMSGLKPEILPFLFSVFIIILVIAVAISVSYAMACIFGDLSIAVTMLPLVAVPMMAFGGFFIAFDSIPPYFQWLSALSYFKYGYETLAINQWDGYGHIPGCELVNSNVSLTACPHDGAEVLSDINFAVYHRWYDAIYLLAMVIAWRFIAFIALLIRTIRAK